jgi:hypothetical protein
MAFKVKEGSQGRHQLADQLTKKFFHSFFGRNREIIEFAKLLVKLKLKSAALELNQAVRVFGDGIEPNVVISRISQKYDLSGEQEKAR